MKKKKKARRASASAVAPARPDIGSGGGLPALAGALALVAAWLAALGAFSAGALPIEKIFDYDTVRPRLVFRDLFLTDAHPADGWRLGSAANYIPDLALSWALFAAGTGAVAGMWLYTLLQPALAAVGWILVCERAYGKSPARRAAVLSLHALGFLFLAYDGPEIFMFRMLPVYHFGTWALAPWALWLLTLAMDGGEKDAGKPPPSSGRKLAATAALFATLAAAIASDLIFLPWFVAPAIAALLCLLALGKTRVAEFLPLAAVLVLSVPLGRFLHAEFGFESHRDAGRVWNFHLEKMLSAPSSVAVWLVEFAKRHPAKALVWTLFSAAAIWQVVGVFRRPSRPRKIFRAPDSRAQALVALFVPASMAATVFGVHAQGWENLPAIWPDAAVVFNHAHPYILPFVYFPLFAGWALLPWRAEFFRVRPVPLASAFCAAVVLLAIPKALSVRAASLDPFNTPFYKCVSKEAKRRNWKGGVGHIYMLEFLAAESMHGVEKILPVGALRRGENQSRLYLDWVGINRRHFDGDFDFVLVQIFNGRTHRVLPRDEGDAGEPAPGPGAIRDVQYAVLLDDSAVRGAFGDPAEIINCAGVGLYHYDPPLRFNFSRTDNPDFAQVGRIF